MDFDCTIPRRFSIFSLNEIWGFSFLRRALIEVNFDKVLLICGVRSVEADCCVSNIESAFFRVVWD